MCYLAGTCDLTPDDSPIISEVPDSEGLYLDVGWGTCEFKACRAAGKGLADLP